MNTLAELELSQDKNRQSKHTFDPCSCCPQIPHCSHSWGQILVVVGSFWLLSSSGLLSFVGNLMWPLVFVGIGLYFLRQAGSS